MKPTLLAVLVALFLAPIVRAQQAHIHAPFTSTVHPTKSNRNGAKGHFSTRLSAAHPPDSNTQSAKATAITGRQEGTRTFPVLDVEITDADVSAELIAAVNDAMTDPVNGKRRLRLFTHVADKVRRTLVITHGIRVFDIPRAAHGFFPLNGDQLSPPIQRQIALNIPRHNSLFPPAGTPDAEGRYRLHQAVHLSSRLNPDGTATVHYELFEHPAVLTDAVPIPNAEGMTLEVENTQDFHSGETIPLPIRTFGPGVQHRVYITVTILPPGK